MKKKRIKRKSNKHKSKEQTEKYHCRIVIFGVIPKCQDRMVEDKKYTLRSYNLKCNK